MNVETMDAKAVVALLAIRHEPDVFIPECKDGPTQGATHVRLDALAIRRSWTTPCVWGYEVKVSRSDFLADNKWPAYLPMCNELYFVCPYGLIQPEEMPDGVGLLWVARTGTRLYAKRKAAHRDVVIDDLIWRYIIICRSWIGDERYPINGHPWKAVDGLAWLARKEEKRDIGRRIGKELGALVKQTKRAARDAEQAAADARECADRDPAIRERLRELGFDPDEPVGNWQLDAEIAELRGVSRLTARQCDAMAANLTGLAARIRGDGKDGIG